MYFGELKKQIGKDRDWARARGSQSLQRRMAPLPRARRTGRWRPAPVPSQKNPGRGETPGFLEKAPSRKPNAKATGLADRETMDQAPVVPIRSSGKARGTATFPLPLEG
jgi:hypothetical protein